jgi:hypothetical protein
MRYSTLTVVLAAVVVVGEVIRAGNTTHNGSTGQDLLLHCRLTSLQLAVGRQLQPAQHGTAQAMAQLRISGSVESTCDMLVTHESRARAL